MNSYSGLFVVLVCGGRKYTDYECVYSTLGKLDQDEGIDIVVQGGASGADGIAAQWAYDTGTRCITVMAEWEKHGKKAGAKRNKRMLEEYNPSLVVAFPGGKGTAHMVKIARDAGVDVMEIV